MIQIKRSLAAVLTLTSSMAIAGGPEVPPQYAANLKAPLAQQLCRAARALELAQGDYAAGLASSTATWEWERGSGRAADNTSGIVALALARTASRCGPNAALERYARARASEHEALRFLYDADIETLALAGRWTGEAGHLDTAREAFARRYGGASGREIVERWGYVRAQRELLGYDAALAIRAALAVGEDQKAREIADAVVAMPRWAEGADPNGFLTTSRGALLEALFLLDGAKGQRFAAARRDLVHHLLLSQASDGSFAGRNTQATAYAVRGLGQAGDEWALSGAGRGRQWLRLTQLSGGTWATFNDLVPEPFVGDLVPEVTAEAMLALAD